MNQTLNLAALVAAYIAKRDEIDVIKKRHAEELAPHQEVMKRAEGYFLDFLDANGIDSSRTEYGTFFKEISTSVTISDREAFRRYIKRSGDWSLADMRANKTGVKEFLESHNEPPPGVHVHREVVVRVRRS